MYTLKRRKGYCWVEDADETVVYETWTSGKAGYKYYYILDRNNAVVSGPHRAYMTVTKKLKKLLLGLVADDGC